MPIVASTAVPATHAHRKTDLNADGATPPGTVSNGPVVTAGPVLPNEQRAAVRVRATIRLRRSFSTE